MNVFVLVEWSGNSAAVDGADILGVFSSEKAAEDAKKRIKRGIACIGRDIFELPLQGEQGA
jgi:hypothetical protein